MLKGNALKLKILSAAVAQVATASGVQGCVTGSAGLWNKTKQTFEHVNDFLDKSMAYVYSIWFLSYVKDLSIDFFNWLRHRTNNSVAIRKPKEAEKILREGFETIERHEREKNEVMDFLLKVTKGKEQNSNKKQNKKGANFILLVGPSGCDKGTMANVLAKAISSGPAFVVPSRDVYRKSKDSVVGQFFGKGEIGYGHGQQGPSAQSCLKEYIEKVKKGVVIIKRYDKVQCENLNKILEDFSQSGTACIFGEKVNASDITFVITLERERKLGRNELEYEAEKSSIGARNKESKRNINDVHRTDTGIKGDSADFLKMSTDNKKIVFFS